MIKVPNMLLIGATEKHAGKTELSTRIIKTYKNNHKIIGIKATVSRENKGKKGFSVSEEKNKDREKDTSRLLAAGAQKVFWLKTDEDHAREGMESILKKIPGDTLIICESNTIRKYIQPAIFLMVKRRESSDEKKTAVQVKRFVSLMIESDKQDGLMHYDPDIIDILNIQNNSWCINKG